MPFPNLTPTLVQRHSTDKSYSRGQDYYRSGAVVSITQRQQTVEAEVEGNEARPYRVVIDVDGAGVTQAVCSCPYSFEGWCKHIVATLLTCIQQPELIEERPSLTDLLAPLTLVQTQDLVKRLVDDQPELIEAVDRYVNLLAQPETSSAKPSRPKRKTSVDPAPFNLRIKPSFQDYEKIQQMAEADWSEIKHSLFQHLRQSKEWGVEQAQVDIFLHEGLVEDAIAAVSKSRSCGS